MRTMIFGLCGMALAVLVCATGLGRGQRPGGGYDVTDVKLLLRTPLTPAQREINRQQGMLEEAAATAANAGDFAKVEIDMRRAMSLGQVSGKGRELLAASLYAQGRTDEALQAYKVIADAGDTFPRNMLCYSLLLLKTGHWARAVAAYNAQLPYLGNGDLMRDYGSFSPDLMRTQDLEVAIHIGMSLTMTGGDFHGAYQDRVQQALAHLQQALALEPDNALTSYYYGYGLRRMGRRAEAQAAFQKAAALDQGNVKQAAEEAMRGG